MLGIKNQIDWVGLDDVIFLPVTRTTKLSRVFTFELES